MPRTALEEYLSAVRSVRARSEEPAPGALPLDPTNISWFRIRRQRLDRRLPSSELVAATYGGLQDSAPRSALLALHARVDGVGPDSWEDERLVQIWFRWADYLVPLADVGVFTLGTLPRSPEQRAALDQLADQVLVALDGNERPTREVGSLLGQPHLLRCTAATGKVHIRWDTRTITVRPAQPANLNEEQARIELARRYLHWLGPGVPSSFAKWSGVTMADARKTWSRLNPELTPVTVEGNGGWILSEDEPDLRSGGGNPVGVRLLPIGDPYLGPQMMATLPGETLRRLRAANTPSRVVNGLGGRVLVDGEIVGAWGRVGGHVTFALFTPLSKQELDGLHAEATSIAGLAGRPVRVTWLER